MTDQQRAKRQAEPLAQIPGTCEICGDADDGGDIQSSMTDPGNWTHTRCLMREEQ